MSTRQYPHYFKPTPFEVIDVYRVLLLFGVSDPCLQHAIKKLLVAGGRGGGKDISKDIAEAIVSLHRWQEMREEDEASLRDPDSDTVSREVGVPAPLTRAPPPLTDSRQITTAISTGRAP